MSDVIPGDQIRSIIERVQRLQEEKRTIEEDIKEVYQEARSNGFDVKVLRAVVKHLGKDQAEVSEFEAIFDLYLQAFEQGASRAHVARDAGARTREAVANAYPDRVSRPAKEQGPSEGEVGSAVRSGAPISEIAAPDLSTAVQSEAAAGESPDQGDDASAAGNGDTLLTAQSSQFVMPSGAGEGPASPADPAPAADAKPRFTLPPAKPLRPNCLSPERCAGYGSTHCGSCERAAKADRRPAYDEELA